MSKIYLYAEILTNIHQVNLHASLETAKTEETKIDISSDRKVVTVVHDGERASIFLPTGIGGSVEVTLPAEKKKELSLRLEIEDLSVLPSFDNLGSNNEYPWPAKDLTSRTQLRCKVCKTSVTKPEQITVWKDLPSENWAEMMDLWHCHKPHDGPVSIGEGAAADAKGYAPSSKIKAAPGTGLVDVSSFLIAQDERTGIQVRRCLTSKIYSYSHDVRIASAIRSLSSGKKKETFRTLNSDISGLVADTITPDRQKRSRPWLLYPLP